MTPRITFSRRALTHLEDIETWLMPRNPDGARNVLGEIRDAVGLIAAFPHLGAPLPVPDLPLDGLRYHVTRRYRYRIVYRAGTDVLQVIAVLHPSRRADAMERA